MTPIDAKVIPIIRKNIAKYGKTVTFTTNSNLGYSPVTGKLSPIRDADPTTSFDVKVTPPSQYDDQEVDGDNIQREDVKIFVQRDGLPKPPDGPQFVPTKQMKVTFDGQSWFVVNIQPIYSGDLIAMYGLQLRR